MPPGAKKRKALKKKKQQQGIVTNTSNNKGSNGDNNLHGHDENGSQDGRESDTNLSSPGSQGNEEFGTKDPSPALSSGLVKGAAKETSGDADVITQGIGQQSGNAIAVERVSDEKKTIVEIPTNSSSDYRTQPAKNVACGNTITEIAPVVDSVKPVVSVSKVVVSEKRGHGETSTHSSLVKQKSDEKEVFPSPGLEQNNRKVVTIPRSAAETSKKVESVKESEVPVSSEEKRVLLPGPPVVVVRRTSWLSCCGLFDAMTGSDR